MTEFSFYHELLDGIFYELERYSVFRIYYRTVARTDESGDSFVLESVNRMNDPEVFGKALEKLITAVRARIMAEMKFLSNRELTIFLEEVLERYLDLKRLVLEPGRTPSLTIKSWGIDGDVYLFQPHRVSRGNEQEVRGNVPGSVLVQASEFARIWFEQMDEAAARARAAVAASWLRTEERNWEGITPVYSQNETAQTLISDARGRRNGNKQPAKEKIVLNCSVNRLGLHLKLLYEEGFFQNTTKMDLCKIISKFICTGRQEEISYRSLKNAMDAPKEQAIRLFVENWANYLEKAEKAMYAC